MCLWRGSPFVVLCAASAAPKLMQPDNLCYAKASAPNYQAADKNMREQTVSKEPELQNEYITTLKLRFNWAACGAQRGLLAWRHSLIHCDYSVENQMIKPVWKIEKVFKF